MDLERFKNENQIYDEHKEVYFVPEPITEMQHRELINEYLKTSGDYYYNISNI